MENKTIELIWKFLKENKIGAGIGLLWWVFSFILVGLSELCHMGLIAILRYYWSSKIGFLLTLPGALAMGIVNSLGINICRGSFDFGVIFWISLTLLFSVLFGICFVIGLKRLDKLWRFVLKWKTKRD